MRFGSRSQPQLKSGLKVSAPRRNQPQLPISIFRFRAHRMSAAPFIRSRKCWIVASRFSGEWDSRSPKARTSRPNGIALMPSILPPIIRRGTSRTHFICRMGACCAPTHPPCKSARWTQRRHPFVLSLPGRPIGAMRSTPRIARSFIRSKVFTWMKMSASPI